MKKIFLISLLLILNCSISEKILPNDYMQKFIPKCENCGMIEFVLNVKNEEKLISDLLTIRFKSKENQMNEDSFPYNFQKSQNLLKRLECDDDPLCFTGFFYTNTVYQFRLPEGMYFGLIEKSDREVPYSIQSGRMKPILYNDHFEIRTHFGFYMEKAGILSLNVQDYKGTNCIESNQSATFQVCPLLEISKESIPRIQIDISEESISIQKSLINDTLGLLKLFPFYSGFVTYERKWNASVINKLSEK